MANNVSTNERLMNDMNKGNQYFESIISKLGYGKKAITNWKEQEADEVGYELYLRAGFNPDDFYWMHKYVLGLESKSSYDKCREEIESAKIPERGIPLTLIPVSESLRL